MGVPAVRRRWVNLPRDIVERIETIAEDCDDTVELEAKARWQLEEYLTEFVEGRISREGFFTAHLAGMEAISRAVQRRLELRYHKDRVMTPENLVAIFSAVGDRINVRVSNPRERQLLAADIAALIKGQVSVLQRPTWEYPSLKEVNPRVIIDDAASS
jgi:hypothetical protein